MAASRLKEMSSPSDIQSTCFSLIICCFIVAAFRRMIGLFVSDHLFLSTRSIPSSLFSSSWETWWAGNLPYWITSCQHAHSSNRQLSYLAIYLAMLCISSLTDHAMHLVHGHAVHLLLSHVVPHGHAMHHSPQLLNHVCLSYSAKLGIPYSAKLGIPYWATCLSHSARYTAIIILASLRLHVVVCYIVHMWYTS